MRDTTSKRPSRAERRRRAREKAEVRLEPDPGYRWLAPPVVFVIVVVLMEQWDDDLLPTSFVAWGVSLSVVWFLFGCGRVISALMDGPVSVGSVHRPGSGWVAVGSGHHSPSGRHTVSGGGSGGFVGGGGSFGGGGARGGW